MELLAWVKGEAAARRGNARTPIGQPGWKAMRRVDSASSLRFARNDEMGNVIASGAKQSRKVES